MSNFQELEASVAGSELGWLLVRMSLEGHATFKGKLKIFKFIGKPVVTFQW